MAQRDSITRVLSETETIVPRPWEVAQFVFPIIRRFDAFIPLRALLEFHLRSAVRENTLTD